VSERVGLKGRLADGKTDRQTNALADTGKRAKAREREREREILSERMDRSVWHADCF